MTRCGHLSVRKQKEIQDKIARSQGYKDHADAAKKFKAGKGKLPRVGKAKVLRFRMFGNRRYSFAGNYKGKAEADREKRRFRANGYLSRTAKDDSRGGYSVWMRAKYW